LKKFELDKRVVILLVILVVVFLFTRIYGNKKQEESIKNEHEVEETILSEDTEIIRRKERNIRERTENIGTEIAVEESVESTELEMTVEELVRAFLEVQFNYDNATSNRIDVMKPYVTEGLLGRLDVQSGEYYEIEDGETAYRSRVNKVDILRIREVGGITEVAIYTEIGFTVGEYGENVSESLIILGIEKRAEDMRITEQQIKTIQNDLTSHR
jgi:hypothetical protein